jgi:hypothetical protein
LRLDDAKTAVRETLQSFANLGGLLLEAQGDAVALEPVIAETLGWESLKGLVATASRLTDTMSAEPLTHVVRGYNRFRRYAPRMLKTLDIQGANVAAPLIKAVLQLRDGQKSEPGT